MTTSVITSLGLQSQLLLAAFAEPQRAVPAWTQWQAQSDWESTVDFDTYLLLPRIYHNLRGQGVEDALFARLKGVVKRNWVANTTTLAGIVAVEKLLRESALTAVLLPPCALLLGDRSLALSPGTPIAYRIGGDDAQHVVRLLCAHGWRSVADGVPHWCLPGYIAATRHLRLCNDELVLDLQWADSSRMVVSATPQVFHGQGIRTLDTLDSIRLLLDAEDTGTEQVRVTRALLLLHQREDVTGWRCLLQLLYQRGSPYAELVESLLPAAAASDARGASQQAMRHGAQSAPQPAPQHESQHEPQQMLQHESASANKRVNTVWKHYQQRWQQYRAALGEEFSAAAALRCLPGYLLGRWRLQHVNELVPTAYRAFRFQWRARRRG